MMATAIFALSGMITVAYVIGFKTTPFIVNKLIYPLSQALSITISIRWPIVFKKFLQYPSPYPN
jgi:hypothetical protein